MKVLQVLGGLLDKGLLEAIAHVSEIGVLRGRSGSDHGAVAEHDADLGDEPVAGVDAELGR